MPASRQNKVLVSCPHCGQQQPEPRTAISTNCKACGQYFRVQEALHPVPKAAERPPEQKRITCFDCGAELDVAVTAESTMCKRCSSYVDLHDYRIANAVSKNFKTKGNFVVELKGYVFNTEATVRDAVIKGRFLGKLIAEHSLTVYSTAEIKGTFKTGRLIIPAENYFRWPEPINVGSAEIAGELVANLKVTNTVILDSTARLFGDVSANHLIIKSGAVLVGNVSVGKKKSQNF